MMSSTSPIVWKKSTEFRHRRSAENSPRCTCFQLTRPGWRGNCKLKQALLKASNSLGGAVRDKLPGVIDLWQSSASSGLAVPGHLLKFKVC